MATTNYFEVRSPEHPHSVESLRELARLYESWDKPEETTKWRAKLPHQEGTLE